MLRQTYQSEPFPYRLPEEISALAFGGAFYHPELVTPPRIYGEEVASDSLAALFLETAQLVDGYDVVNLIVQQDQVRWPSYNYTVYRWNATTGAFLGRILLSGSFVFRALNQSRDGQLWVLYFGFAQALLLKARVTAQGLEEFPVEYDVGTLTGEISVNAFNVDQEQNVLLLGGADEPHYALKVHDLTTGALLRAIQLPGRPQQIMPEDRSRCYVMTSDQCICLVDYVAGKVLSVFQVQASWETNTQYKTITWDRRYRRFLVWEYTPVTTEGQNTSVVKGYYPTPQPYAITQSIPLKPPRKYRSVPLLTRISGDIAEPMSGARVTLESDNSAVGQITSFPAITDTDGESIGTLYGADSGSVEITATAVVS